MPSLPHFGHRQFNWLGINSYYHLVCLFVSVVCLPVPCFPFRLLMLFEVVTMLSIFDEGAISDVVRSRKNAA